MLKGKPISLDENLPWDELIRLSRTATFFQQRQWLQIWLNHFPTDHEIVGIYDENELIGIAPLSYDQEHVYLLGTTSVLGKEIVVDFGDSIALPGREKDVWTSLLRYVSKNYSEKKFQFNFIRESSPSFSVLKDLATDIESNITSPYLDLPSSWDEYLAHLKRKNRHELRRKLRKLESVPYLVYQADPTESNQHQFLALMKQSSPEKETFLSEPMVDFFTDLLTHLKKEQLLLWFMEVERKKVAAALAFKFKDELFLYNSGMDGEYKHLSVGLLSTALLIKKSIELGYKRFDFLQGNEPYKYNLGALDNKLHLLVV